MLISYLNVNSLSTNQYIRHVLIGECNVRFCIYRQCEKDLIKNNIKSIVLTFETDQYLFLAMWDFLILH